MLVLAYYSMLTYTNQTTLLSTTTFRLYAAASAFLMGYWESGNHYLERNTFSFQTRIPALPGKAKNMS